MLNAERRRNKLYPLFATSVPTVFIQTETQAAKLPTCVIQTLIHTDYTRCYPCQSSNQRVVCTAQPNTDDTEVTTGDLCRLLAFPSFFAPLITRLHGNQLLLDGLPSFGTWS
ncbi:hypothetical protein BaRGS_00004012 [Batillaria attramentaria]|uniref:Uncharacterized protein n=1 Tax=Batillaria attramentaria TaxID=370345 RepID=A0ABD0M101_9CAEN